MRITRVRVATLAAEMALLFALTGCITMNEVRPNLAVSKEIPPAAAQVWLQRVVADFGWMGPKVPACVYVEGGVRARSGGATIAFRDLRTAPHEFLKPSSDMPSNYSVTSTDEAAAAYVGLNIKGSTRPESACCAYWKLVKNASAVQIAEEQKNVERTLSALASLGVDVVPMK